MTERLQRIMSNLLNQQNLVKITAVFSLKVFYCKLQTPFFVENAFNFCSWLAHRISENEIVQNLNYRYPLSPILLN